MGLYSHEYIAEIALFFKLLILNQPQPYSASFFSEEFDEPMGYMPPKYTHGKGLFPYC